MNETYNDTLKERHKEGVYKYFALLEILDETKDEFDRSMLRAKVFLQGIQNQEIDRIIKRPLKIDADMTVADFKPTK